jgi:hypothetical protein
MERAERLEVAPGFGQSRVPAHHLNDVYSLFDFFNGAHNVFFYMSP